jgi:anti-anti-sigma factor
MTTALGTFAIERRGETLLLIPQRNLNELDFEAMQEEQEVRLRFVNDLSVRNVVVDLGQIDYFGSSTLRLFTRLWMQVRHRQGNMALCNVSAHTKEILTVTGLAGLWPAYGSTENALEAVSG